LIDMPLNQSEVQERLRQKFGERSARTGGKGAFRRKYKAVSKTATQDDKRLNSQLKKLNITQIPAIEEVNLFKDDGSVVHFTKPKVQAEISSNTYVVQGTHATKKLEELFPDILPQLGGESIEKLKHLAQTLKQANFSADDVPRLVDENFEDVAKRDEKMEEVASKPSNDNDKPPAAATAVENNEDKKQEVTAQSAMVSTSPATGDSTVTNISASTSMTSQESKTEPVTLEPDLNQAVSV